MRAGGGLLVRYRADTNVGEELNLSWNAIRSMENELRVTKVIRRASKPNPHWLLFRSSRQQRDDGHGDDAGQGHNQALPRAFPGLTGKLIGRHRVGKGSPEALFGQ